jgi:hypothetical protein
MSEGTDGYGERRFFAPQRESALPQVGELLVIAAYTDSLSNNSPAPAADARRAAVFTESPSAVKSTTP